MEFTSVYKNFLTLKSYRKADFDGEQEVQGISFKYKTVQFHIIDDTLSEINMKLLLVLIQRRTEKPI